MSSKNLAAKNKILKNVLQSALSFLQDSDRMYYLTDEFTEGILEKKDRKGSINFIKIRTRIKIN